ncbi:hypothetical protein PN36_27995 [Candidatus Thiomargarita nelsonii]|uniref:Uncharacterized protein n=1 Tax=Candidatus Thiomargarita nelsonii TaxID=1003181 RepID=A0A0A6PGX2_9GAMM|nr:hypothetical protein PN36_27995 [Candidatus Thiomargarita nelsonii]
MNIFKLISYIPLLGVVLALYFVMEVSGVNFADPNSLFSLPLPSGAEWNLTGSDIFIMLGTITLFIEIVKSARTGTGTIFEHALSLVVFIVFLILFLLVESAGTSAFLIVSLMSLLDVIAGFTITIATARRDYAVSPG